MVNIERNRLILGASIRGQCSRRNFYGPAEVIENAFSVMETLAGRVISEILKTEDLPASDSAKMRALLAFIVMQRSRGRAAAGSNDAMTDMFAKLHMEGAPSLSGIDLDDYEIRNEYPSALPVAVAAEAVPHSFDLGVHLILNNTERDLITSDEPVVAHNQYCQGIDYQGVCGWLSSGIQILLPLSPRALLLVYDKHVYKIGGRRKLSSSHILDPVEIDHLNDFQILNANDNVYLLHGDHGQRLAAQVRQISKRRPKERMQFVRTERVPDGDGESELCHVYEPLLPLNLTLKAVSIRRNLRRVPLYRRGWMQRNRSVPDASGERRSRQSYVRYPIKE